MCVRKQSTQSSPLPSAMKKPQSSTLPRFPSSTSDEIDAHENDNESNRMMRELAVSLTKDLMLRHNDHRPLSVTSFDGTKLSSSSQPLSSMALLESAQSIATRSVEDHNLNTAPTNIDDVHDDNDNGIDLFQDIFVPLNDEGSSSSSSSSSAPKSLKPRASRVVREWWKDHDDDSDDDDDDHLDILIDEEDSLENHVPSRPTSERCNPRRRPRRRTRRRYHSPSARNELLLDNMESVMILLSSNKQKQRQYENSPHSSRSSMTDGDDEMVLSMSDVEEQ